MRMTSSDRSPCVVASFCFLLLCSAGKRASAGPLSATLSLEPNPQVSVLPGETAEFDVFLRDFDADSSSDFVFSFGLNVGASDPVLTGSGTDFSPFGFTLNSGLSGIIGGTVFDGDISDDGRVEYGADTPPFGTETGILESTGDVKLGTLSVVSPPTLGSYDVAFNVDSIDPIGGGTYFLVDDGSFFGQTLPGAGTLSVTNSSVNAVPEPSSLSLFAMGTLSFMGYCVSRRRKSC